MMYNFSEFSFFLFSPDNQLNVGVYYLRKVAFAVCDEYISQGVRTLQDYQLIAKLPCLPSLGTAWPLPCQSDVTFPGKRQDSMTRFCAAPS